MFFPARCLPTNPPRWPAVGRGPRVTCARNPSSPDGAACSWKRRITVWGGGRGADELGGLGRIRLSARCVTKVAFAMETDVLGCHLQSVGRPSVLVAGEGCR